MTDLQRDKLSVIAGDESMFSALKSVFEDRIEEERPKIEVTDTDEMIGAKYRAYRAARKILMGALVDIGSHKRDKVESNNHNKGK